MVGMKAPPTRDEQIIEMLRDGVYQKEIALRFGLSRSMITVRSEAEDVESQVSECLNRTSFTLPRDGASGELIRT